MKRFIVLFLLLFAVNCNAAILLYSPSGNITETDTLAKAAVAKGVIKVEVTSALSSSFGNISSATLHEWPSDKMLIVAKGGSIDNTTKFKINGPFIAGSYQVFTGSGSVIFLSGSVDKQLGIWTGKTGDTPSEPSADNAISDINSYYSNLTSDRRWPRNVVFIGDSITYGWPNGTITHQQSSIGVLQTMLNNTTGWNQGNWPNGGIWQRWTLAGSTAEGTKGPVGRSLVMQPNATATVSGDYIDQIILYYQKSSGAGSVEIRVNSNLVGTITTTGTATDDALTITNLSPRIGIGATVELKCVTAAVELTSVYIFRTVGANAPRIISHAYPGFSTNQYTSSAILTSLNSTVDYTVQPPLFVIALGSNDMFNVNAGYNASSAKYETNLRTIVAGLNGGKVLMVPLKPTTRAFAINGEAFENYRAAIYRVANDYGLSVIDASSLDFITTGFYQGDGIHPTVNGYTALAAFWYRRLFAGIVTDDQFDPFAITLSGGATATGDPYSIPAFTIERNGNVRLSGAINITGIAKVTTIGYLTDATTYFYPDSPRPIKQKNVLAHINNGTTGGWASLLLYPTGEIVLLDYMVGANTTLSLDGITFNTLY